jgi:thiol-disulfide isomerase/thioredoxin
MNSSGTEQERFMSEPKKSLPVNTSFKIRCFRGVLLGCIAVIIAKPVVFYPQDVGSSALIKMHERAPEFPRTMSSTTQFSSPPTLPPTPTGSPRGMPDVQVTPSPGASAPRMAPGPANVQWINSPALTMEGLRGKVVLIDFWEYTCINCIRTFDENKKWYERYHKYGFEIVGVHCPEFDIAYHVSNVKDAVKRFGLPYPIVVDDKFLIWRAYHNSTWPNRFLIDAKGYIRYDRSGEGGDSALEHAIQQLLKEGHPGLEIPSSYTIPPEKNAFAPSCGMTTPEMYVGQWEDRGILSNKQGYHKGKTINYILPASVEDGHTAVSGRWETDKGQRPGQSNGMIYRGKKKGETPSKDELIMRYHARELYSVMNVQHGRASRVYVRQDGKDLTSQNKGVDVQFDTEGHSFIEVREPRMYYLTANPKSGSHKVELFPTRSGLTINSFTFGNDCQTDFLHL